VLIVSAIADLWEERLAILNRDGIALYYEVHGEGPALLLTHGYSSTSHMWAGQIGPLSKHFKVITWDMRGHGRTTSPDDPALYSDARRAVIGGLSLGGYMSLAFHLNHPERTRALLIIDTGPGFKNDEARAQWNARAIRTAERFESEGLERLASAGSEVRESRHASAKHLALAARGMLAQRDACVISSLPDIKVPSLVIVGANDAPFLNAADYMAAKIPGAKKVVIADAGHGVNIDQPKSFDEAVLGFLRENKLVPI